ARAEGLITRYRGRIPVLRQAGSRHVRQPLDSTDLFDLRVRALASHEERCLGQVEAVHRPGDVDVAVLLSAVAEEEGLTGRRERVGGSGETARRGARDG